MTPLHILISLHRGYGLGDAVQMSAVLQHVAKAHSNWIIDYQAEEGKHQVGRGIVANTFAYGQPYPSEHYDGEVQIVLYDKWHGYHDRPNTHVSSCLRECFDLEWNQESGRYRVNVSEEAMQLAGLLMFGKVIRNPAKFVAVHYEGDTSPTKKNLTHKQADAICCEISRLGYIPIILDWRCRSPLPRQKLWAPAAWGGNAEMVCAIISQCKAFVGIDSGPGKCASATDTPTMIVWTGHHPAPFHDPAPNTTHLVPVDYHHLEPVCNDPGVTDWFEAHYDIRQYRSYPIYEIGTWLSEVLR